MKIYGDINSGNSYKIKLLLSLLDIAHEWQHIDILAAQTRTENFLAMNPNGKIPVVDFGDGSTLWESNAILNYFAKGTSFLPADNFLHAKVLQWQFFEQYSHEPYIAVARFINKYLNLPPARADEYRSKQAGGHMALAVMEAQLGATPFLIGDDYTIADISLYAYTHVAAEGGFDLNAYPYILAWLRRIEAQPRHVTMEQFAV